MSKKKKIKNKFKFKIFNYNFLASQGIISNDYYDLAIAIIATYISSIFIFNYNSELNASAFEKISILAKV